MRTTAPPKDWREARRLRAWDLHQQGWKQGRIAEALGVTQGAVSQWLARARDGGMQALYSRSPPGAPLASLLPNWLNFLPSWLAAHLPSGSSVMCSPAPTL